MTTTHQSGSILVYILIAVALFAALGYSVSQMMRGGGEHIGQEKTGIYISDLLDYTKNIRGAVQMLRISDGCTEEELSFERSPFDGSDTDYVNPNAPSDFSCHIFHPLGGGAAPSNPIENINDGAPWYITAHNTIPDIGGANASELLLILPNLNKALCLAVNDRLGVTNPANDAPIDTNGIDDTPFIGTYSAAEEISTSALIGAKPTGCIKDTSTTPNIYYLYQLLLAR